MLVRHEERNTDTTPAATDVGIDQKLRAVPLSIPHWNGENDDANKS